MFDIVFPSYTGQRYWNIHFEYVLNIFKYLKCTITFKERESFIIAINGRDFLIDYSDNAFVIPKVDLPIFKFHTLETDLDKVIPFPPVSFHNWDEYYELEKKIEYSPSNDIISNRQRIYGNAIERRTKVQTILKNLLMPSFLKTDEIPQTKYWEEINELGLSIHAPGYSNHILDRGQLQYMAFGMCTLSPYLPEQLPLSMSMTNTYIPLDEDFSNLSWHIINKNNSLKNLEMLKSTGDNAKKVFKSTCTPEAIGDWISLHV